MDERYMKLKKYEKKIKLLLYPSVSYLLPATLLAQENGSALVEAARSGNIAEVERLLAAGADVDWQDDVGDTAL